MRSGRADDGHLILDRQVVEVSRSDWTFELGPLRLARHRSVRRQLEYGPPLRRRAGGLGIGVIAAGGLAIAAPVYLTQAKVLVAPPYVVSQAVPERPPIAAFVRSPAAKRSRPLHGAPRLGEPSGAITDTNPSGSALDADRATAAAWRTGEAQDWAEGGAHGIVVPGEVEHSEGYVCRTLARLTRQNGLPDAVEQSRRCSAMTPRARGD